jgi:hypothetical protein
MAGLPGMPRNMNRVDRFGVAIQKGQKVHKVCFADEKPNGRTSGVTLIKTYNVECFKEYNKLNESSSKIKPATKDKYVEDTGEFSCSCALF